MSDAFFSGQEQEIWQGEAESFSPSDFLFRHIVTVVNARGLHARASACLVRLAEKFDADICLMKDGLCVRGTSIIGLMMLAARSESQIEIMTRGPQAEEALDAIVQLFAEGFGEEA